MVLSKIVYTCIAICGINNPIVGFICWATFNCLTFVFFKYFGKYAHKEIFPNKVDKTYIQKYIPKSSVFFTNANIEITLINFTITFLVTVFLNSSNPWKNQLISKQFANNSNNKIL